MARLMVGRDLLALYPPRPPAPAGEPALEVAHFMRRGLRRGRQLQRAARAKSSASPGWSAPGAPNSSRLCSAFARVAATSG